MLLPSDLARLVLGYLQEEGLSATSRAFIHESPNLKEYADHATGDGAIPACVFSLFGKGLTTILNEYVAVKTKESRHEVPAVMTSLWKKLDFTLNQIKSLQNSPSISACQRVRSCVGMANLARQRALTLMPTSGAVCSSVSETNAIIGPARTPHSALSHSTPVSSSDPHIRPTLGNSTLSTPRDSPVHIIVSENRLNPGPMSPGRRKWDTPRKRSGAQIGSSGQSRPAAATSNLSAEPQAEEVVDENFPQLVIQSARDKILGDRSLQEKLAENINKILANEPAPQTSKASLSAVEEDQSIDEILGLQGEIHMSDDAIHDILEQTESDPAFQALFDLFDYNKNKFTDEDGGDDIVSIPEETDTAGPSSADRPVQSDDPGVTQTHTNNLDVSSATQKLKSGQDRRTRKTATSTIVKKVLIGSNGRSSRIENSSARLLINPVASQSVPPAAKDTNKTVKASLLNNCADVTPMDLEEPLNTPPLPVDTMAIQEAAPMNHTATTNALSVPASVVSSKDAVISVPEVESVSDLGKNQENKRTQAFTGQPSTASASASSSPPVFLSPAPIVMNSTSAQAGNLVETSVLSSENFSTSVSTGAIAPLSCPSTPTALGLTASVSTSTTLATASIRPASSCPLDTASPACSTANPSTANAAPADSSDIVSLKIIVSENPEEESSSDAALTQAISSITGDKIPTIYLSSPAKSTGGPATPRANSDEAAQAVSGLQNSEVHASPVSYKAATLIASPATGTSQTQQNYIIQLPLDTSNSALQGASASYIFVAEPSTADVQTTQMLLPAGVAPPQTLPTSPYGLNPQAQTQAFSPGSALILPSRVKPVVLPVSVVGQNSLANVQMVSNQLVAIPKPVTAQQTENVKPKPKQTAAAGGRKVVSKKADQSAAGPSHRRILCFESQAVSEPETVKATETSTPAAPNTTTSQSPQQPEKDPNPSLSRTKPAILGGNKPKRRVETVRCSAEPSDGGSFVKESNHFQQKDARKNSRKQDHNNCKQASSSENGSSTHSSQPETGKKSESEKRSKSIDRKHSQNSRDDTLKGKDAHHSRSSDSSLKSGTKKDKEESGRKEPADKNSKSRDGRAEKKAPSQTVPNVTANKENEMKGSVKEQNQPSMPSPSASRDFSPSAAAQPASNPQSKAAKTPSKTSSLAKQAAEMLQDIQGLNSPSTPTKRPGAEQSLPGSGAGCDQETPAECPGTPLRQKKGKDVEGTPKRLLPPNTPDVPTSSPASEAGSESSINMAAHTLMILSRAAIARTGTPLKDNLRQEEAGEKSPASLKISKKRKQSSPTSSPPPKKEAKQSPSKKKDRERKKLMDCFPLDLDVDKFLSSLHYDE